VDALAQAAQTAMACARHGEKRHKDADADGSATQGVSSQAAAGTGNPLDGLGRAFFPLSSWQPHQDVEPLHSVRSNIFISKNWVPQRITFQPDFMVKTVEVSLRVTDARQTQPDGGDAPNQVLLPLAEDKRYEFYSSGHLDAAMGRSFSQDGAGAISMVRGSSTGLSRAPSMTAPEGKSNDETMDQAATLLLSLSEVAAARRALHALRRQSAGDSSVPIVEVYAPGSGAMLDLDMRSGVVLPDGSVRDGGATGSSGNLWDALRLVVSDAHLPRALLKFVNADLYYSRRGGRRLLRAMASESVGHREAFFQAMVDRRRERPRASWAGTPLATLFTTRDEAHLRQRRRLVARVADAMAESGVSMARLFAQADRDHSGVLNSQELQGLLADVGVSLAPSDVTELITALDTDRDECISLDELRAALSHTKGLSAATARVLSGAAEPSLTIVDSAKQTSS